MKDFARIIGVSSKTYEHYEYGTRKPNVQFLLQLVGTIGVSSDYLLGLTDDPTPASKRAPAGAVTVNGHGNAVANGNGNAMHHDGTIESRVAALEAIVAKLSGRQP